MTKYVLGFMFDLNNFGVLLIQKQKPKWQKGLLNGIGGKIEEGENSLQAIIREFKEETGIEQSDWQYVADIFDDTFRVDIYTCKTDSVYDYKTMEEEMVIYVLLDELKDFIVVSNLDWIIPMCLDVKNINYKINR